MPKYRKLDHIILLRSVAIILVVLGHATRSIHLPNSHMYSPTITPWWEIKIKNYIYSFHMPLFFWISGFVFYYSSIEKAKQATIISRILNKVKRLILPMYSTSFLILLPTIYFFGHINGSMLYQIKLFLFGYDNGHLWFLKTIFIIFVAIIPLYYLFPCDGKMFYALIFVVWGLLFIFKSALPGIAISPVRYFPFFLLGCLTRKHEYMFDDKNLLIYSTAFFVIYLITQLINKTNIYISKDLVWYLSAFFGTYYMYFIASFLDKYLINSKSWPLIKRIDKASYSIYLFHVSFLYIILFLDFKYNINSAEIRVFLSFFSGLILSVLMHELFSRNRMLSVAFSITFNKDDHTSKSGLD